MQSLVIDSSTQSGLTYVCDPSGRMIAAVSPSDQQDYHFDAEGNLLCSSGTGGTVNATCSYGADGHLVSATDVFAGQAPLMLKGFSTPGNSIQPYLRLSASSWYDGWLDGTWGSHIPILGGWAAQAGTDYGNWESGHGSGWKAAWSIAKVSVGIAGTALAAVEAPETLAHLITGRLTSPLMPKRPSMPKGPVPPGWNEQWWPGYGPRDKQRDPHWFDPDGGEWRWHEPDNHHDKGHWDYNPWEKFNDSWRNVDENGQLIPKDGADSENPCPTQE